MDCEITKYAEMSNDLLFMIFIRLPTNVIQEIYYDTINKIYWTNFPVRLDHNFWLNKATYEFKITEKDFNDSSEKGYYRYAEILSRRGICNYSIKLLNSELFLFRAAKFDNIELFIKGYNNYNQPLSGRILNIIGPNTLKYCVFNNIINLPSFSFYVQNPHVECIDIIRSKDFYPDSVFYHKLNYYLAIKDKMNVLRLLYKMPDVLFCFSTPLLNIILKLFPMTVIHKLSLNARHGVFEFIDNLCRDQHVCGSPNLCIAIKIKMLYWAKAGRICCIIHEIHKLPHKARLLKYILDFLSEENINLIMSKCDVRSFNAVYALIYYPNLLYQHKNWSKYRIGPKCLNNVVIYDDQLENYMKLLKIGKEIGFLLPVINYSSEIIGRNILS
jgi:hypothetical protein